ncbi:MAG: hypothetical protein PWQ59_1854 [Thermoanaerobacterium sp.]|jgi:hypothetical protein|nr:hypothetical protein [Thermoanaerobacterium sp.]
MLKDLFMKTSQEDIYPNRNEEHRQIVNQLLLEGKSLEEANKLADQILLENAKTKSMSTIAAETPTIEE